MVAQLKAIKIFSNLLALHNLSCIILALSIGQIVSTSRENQSCDGKSVKDDVSFDHDGHCSRSHQVATNLIGHEDRRESTAWRWKYIDEFVPDKNSVLVNEKLIDERLANIVYTIGSSKTKIYSFKFNSGDPRQDRENQRIIAGPQVDDELCAEHLRRMLDLMDELKMRLEIKRRDRNNSIGLDPSHIRLARALDSFGRYDSGYLSGRTHSLGSYDQCLGSQLILNKNKVNMRFCWAQMKLDRHLDVTLGVRQRSEFEADDNIISSGICVPNSCHSKSFNKNKELFQKLVDSQFKLPKSIYLDENLQLSSIYCLVDDNGQFGLPLNGKILLVILFGWLFFTVSITLKNREHPKLATEPGKQHRPLIMECLDLNESWKDFIIEREIFRHQERKVELDAMNPIKVLSTAYVVMGHAILYCWNASMNYIQAASLYETDRSLLPMMVGTYVVDTFFVITGILLSFHLLKRMIKWNALRSDKDKSIDHGFFYYFKLCYQFILARYLRLMPLFFLMFWAKKSVLIYLGSGPYWDSGFDRQTVIGSCRHQEGWLDIFSPLSAYVPISRKCIPQGWSISADLFLTLVAVPVIVLLSRKPKLGFCLLLILCVSSVKMAQNAFARADPTQMWEVNEMKANAFGYMLNELSYLYTGPHYRLSSILMGVLAGYALVLYDQDDKITKWPAWFTGPATTVALVLSIWPFFSASMITEIKATIQPHHHMLYPSLSTTYRVIWAASNAILLTRIVTDWKDWYIFRMGRDKFWRILVKLDYAILLIHIDLIIFNLSDPTSARIFSKYRALSEFAGVYLISLVLAVIIYCVIESPLDKLIKRLVHSNKGY